MAISHERRLSTVGLAAIIYYSVCGGPFGIEDTVSAAGPLLTIVGLLVMPFVWSFPEALITAELATAFPDNAGYVAWVQAAFGPFWGFMEGYLSWVSGVVDNAVYPVLFSTYLRHAWPALKNDGVKQLCIFCFTFACSLLNYLGLNLVGWAALALAIFTMLPFAYMVAVGLPRVELSNLAVVPDWSKIDWMTYVNVLFWNLNYWDSASTLAGEVRDAPRTFPRAIMVAMVLVLLSYLPVLVVGLGVPGGPAWQDWEGGTLAEVAGVVGGDWVKLWVVIAAGVGNIGLFISEQAEDAYQMQGMAKLGWLPAVFARRSRFGTPTAALVVGAGIILGLSWMDFLDIVDLLNGVYCLAQLLEFAAFLQLRRRRPDLERPFRVPLSTGGCVALVTLPTVLALFILIAPVFLKQWWQTMSIVAVAIAGVLLFMALDVCRRRQWLSFERAPPATMEEMLAACAEKETEAASSSSEDSGDESDVSSDGQSS